MSSLIHKAFKPFHSPRATPQKATNSSTQMPSSTTQPQPPSTATTTTTAPATSGPLQPVTVIELFQSQGCNSCPPANASLLARPTNTTELLLTYEVTYWDYLGWVDTFGDKRWDARQTAYASALRQRSCYTPQVIVDGGARPMGGGWRDLGALLARGAGKPLSRVTFEAVEGGNGVKIIGGEGWAVVLVVFYEMEPKPVKILRGENRGETERYRNVVRDLKEVGSWDGGEVMVELPERRKGLEMAVLIQAGSGGQILGAARV